MSILSKVAVPVAIVMFSLPATAAVNETQSKSQTRVNSESKPKEQILLAKKRRKKSRKAREKHISREAKQRSRDSKNIDFDAVDIGGATKTPMSSLINQNKDLFQNLLKE